MTTKIIVNIPDLVIFRKETSKMGEKWVGSGQ
jgi:hypothetical protein